MLGPRIAALRKAAGWSQAELAQMLKISPSAVGMYEQGRREPAVDILVSMANLFGVTTDYLLTGRTDFPKEETVVSEAMLRTLTDADLRLCKRDNRPFSKDELAVLLTAMLLDS